MAKIRLICFHLDEELNEKLTKANLLTVEDVLQTSPLSLMDQAGISNEECSSLRDQLFFSCLPILQNVNDLAILERQRCISLGNDQLNNVLHGGLHPGTVSEFVGPSGIGKTQWCLTITVDALTKVEGKPKFAVIYIDTEATVRPERIVEILTTKYTQDSSVISEVLNVVHVYQPTTVTLFTKILYSLEAVAVSKNIGLIIVDSIASLARKQYSGSNMQSNTDRTNLLASWASTLKSLAQLLHICVIVTNQVTTRQSLSTNDFVQELVSDANVGATFHQDISNRGLQIQPALGNTWTHFVNTRFTLQLNNINDRQIMISKSAVSPVVVFPYVITSSGIEVKNK